MRDLLKRVHPLTKSALRLLASVAGSAMTCSIVIAQQYPTKPVRIIVTNGPGSGPEIVSRIVGQKLTESFGQPMVIDIRAGANGIIGTEIAARAAPDGHTLVMITSQTAIVSATVEKLNYDLIRDFAPISLLGSTPFAMVVHASVAANSVSELVAHLKTRPLELRFGTSGSASPSHLAAEIFMSMTGSKLFHVPYKTVGQAVTETMSGEVHLTLQAVPSVLALVKSGRLKVLGVTGARRSTLTPDWPAVAEAVPGYEFYGWYGVSAPARTPAAIIAKLNAELVNALKTPDFRERLTSLGAEPSGTTPRVLAEYTVREIEKMRKAAKAAGLRADF